MSAAERTKIKGKSPLRICQNCKDPIHGFGFLHIPSDFMAVCSDCWDELEDKLESEAAKLDSCQTRKEFLVNTSSVDAHWANE